uniref:Kexin n=1 Tax=Pneumocystis carinii TaxID=4754 RepID=O94096_PNECA|nr:kexin [Pneumocystis carinii]
MIFKILITFFLYWIYLVRVRCEKKPVDFENNDYYHFHFSEEVDIEDFSRALGFKHYMKLEYLDNQHIFSIEKSVLEDEIKEKIENYFGLEKGRNAIDGFNSDKLFYYEKQKLVKRENRGAIRDDIYFDNEGLYNRRVVKNVVKDPTVDQAKKSTEDLKKRLKEIKGELNIEDRYFDKQWYLFNTKDPGVDINVTGLWLEGIRGKGVTVAIVDNGIDYTNLDLAPNFNAEASLNFATGTTDVKPEYKYNNHGTRSAGEVAAARNDFCGIGVAYESNISGLRYIPSAHSSWNEGDALIYKYDVNHIYSCSWGPADTGNLIQDISYTSYSAIIKGINEGKNGLGSIYVFGSGNGGYFDDCNYDGYANSPYTITIAAIDAKEERFMFSEPCPCILASTYSGRRGAYIYTTDVGTTECTFLHTGTSASTPLAAGVIALLLSACPNLTWRDVQALIVETAVPFNPSHPDWDDLPSGRRYNNFFGYGKLDAYRMVEKARTFKTLNPQTMFSTHLIPVYKKFSQSNGHIKSSFYIHRGYPTHYNFKNLEYVGVSFHYQHQRRGHLEFNITSPSGVTSVLAHRRNRDKHSGIVYWTFMSVKHWGEPIVGNWTIDVEDKKEPNLDGEVFDWQLHFFGESSKSEGVPPASYPFLSRYPTTTPPPEPTTTLPPTPSSTPSSRPPPPPPPPAPAPAPPPPPPPPPPRPEPEPEPQPQPEQKPTSITSSTSTTSSKTKISTTRKASSTKTSSTTKTSTRPSPTEGTFTGSSASHLSFFEKRHLLFQMILLLFFFLFLGYSF